MALDRIELEIARKNLNQIQDAVEKAIGVVLFDPHGCLEKLRELVIILEAHDQALKLLETNYIEVPPTGRREEDKSWSEYIDLQASAERVRKRLQRVQSIQNILAEVLQDSIEEQKVIELQIEALGGGTDGDDGSYHKHKRKEDPNDLR